MNVLTSKPLSPPPVVLASASSARAAVLRAAGIDVILAPAHIDEGEIKQGLRAENAEAGDAATVLAELKARRVAAKFPDALIIGADQILVCEGEWFDKPVDIDDARAHLRALRGKTHGLATSAVVLRGGERIWHHIETPKLTMRSFSDAFIDDYLAREGDDALQSVGAYRLEGIGAQLFTRVEGDFFTILGLPLLPLIGFLREHGVVAS